MNHFRKKSGIVLLTILLFGMTSCEKSSTGPKGDTGATGNANVKASTYQVSTWTNGTSFWYADLDVKDLTSTAQSSGAIEVFLSTDNGTAWHALPLTFVSSTDYFMGFATATGLVEIQWTYNGIGNGSNPNTMYGSTCQFKVVVIPPARLIPGVNTHNYEELKAAYDLK